MVLLPQAGHAVQEDEPGKTARAILAFAQRYAGVKLT
jgi:pimeloyl-ACP methyl ester carboxylesterase